METVHQLLAAADSELQAPLAIAVITGLRRGELLGLRWSDIDLDAGRLIVRRSIEVVQNPSGHYERREKPPKTKRSARTIALAPTASAVLRRQRADQRQRRFQLGLPRDENCYVFDRADGTPWEPGAFSLAFARLVKRAELPHFRLHDLRHVFATQSLVAGIDLKTVSASLGHSDIGTTANLYAHVQEQLLERHAARVEAIMGDALAIAAGDARVSPAAERKSRVSHGPVLRLKMPRKIRRIDVAPTGIEPVFPP
jgi:integrase